jgi:hypothetical protein
MPVRLSRWTDAVITAIAGAVGPIVERLAGVDLRLGALEQSRQDSDARQATMIADLADLVDRLKAIDVSSLPGLTADVAGLRDRLAALEAAPPTPGPSGEPGAAGVGFADPPMVFDGVRTFTFRYSNGTEQPIVPPVLVYRDVYVDGKPYAPGDVVSSSGNLWHCNASTLVRPGTDVSAWTLMVRRGRDRKG